MMPVYIGYDEREDLAYRVCRNSILAHTPGDVVVSPLRHRELRKRQLFWREWRVDADAQYWDVTDGKPFSTQFSHSRFLTPLVASEDFPAASWALFVDCDFLFRRNLAELFALADPAKAVMVVKHQQPDTGAMKMDGCKQVSYPRKNWSSLVLFNLKHSANERLTAECVNQADGSWLHQFSWLDDELIGELPADWNHLIAVNSPNDNPAAAHFTLGGPWFDAWPHSRFDAEWEDYAKDIRYAPKTSLRRASAAQ